MGSMEPSQTPPRDRIRQRSGRLAVASALASALAFSVVGAPQASAATASQISAGGGHTCALSTEGGVTCWGYNYHGQLGDGTTTNSSTPVDVSGLSSGVTQISAGTLQTCALTTGGGVKCWGYPGDSLTPVDVPGLSSGVTQISAGYLHTCVVTTGGGAKCWGFNLYGALGDGTTTNSSTPVDVSGLSSGVAQISTGQFHTCALMTGGAVKCWGYNLFGQLGDGTRKDRLIPVDVSGLSSGVAELDAGESHTCAVTIGGRAKCWGSNYRGQVGDGTRTDRRTPVDVVGLTSGVAQVSTGHHSCALTTGGGVRCWGYNGSGQLGDRTMTDRPRPVAVSGLASDVGEISAGEFHTCALTAGGGAKCWGSNSNGQLGDGTMTDRSTPTNVSGLSSGGVFQPDGLVKRSSDANYIGDDIYNTTAQHQSVTGAVVAGRSVTWDIKVHNDGDTDDPMTLVGCHRSSGFVVKYFTSTGINITPDVVDGAQSTGTLAPDGEYDLILRIRSEATTASGQLKACKVIATSFGDTRRRDAIKATLIVR